ncbi:cytochrome c1 [Hydrogenophaga sp. 5NK40-0174]|uniref:cytochrome c1 n=1 Tax=Hydrogenophaga sp. 5NK40-0174 TaxID=3127649 RepID=UPI0031034A19
MKKILLGIALALGMSSAATAAGGGFPIDKAPNRVTDQAALQRGAKIFVNYCLNCHSAAFMRYNRLRDIGLEDKEIQKYFTFATDKIGDTMKASINAREAKDWFGATPPDLTVIARSRAGHGYNGADYIYTLLRTYYRDGTKATGWNNKVFPSIAMPHPLWQLQGEQKPVIKEVESHGHTTEIVTGWEQVKPGTMSKAEYDDAVGDLVAYLQWMGEPAQTKRVRVGVWVLIFLSVFTLIAWRLNAAYWKDVK